MGQEYSHRNNNFHKKKKIGFFTVEFSKLMMTRNPPRPSDVLKNIHSIRWPNLLVTVDNFYVHAMAHII